MNVCRLIIVEVYQYNIIVDISELANNHIESV
jgi:hypothetical protein